MSGLILIILFGGIEGNSLYGGPRAPFMKRNSLFGSSLFLGKFFPFPSGFNEEKILMGGLVGFENSLKGIEGKDREGNFSMKGAIGPQGGRNSIHFYSLVGEILFMGAQRAPFIFSKKVMIAHE